MRPHTALSRRRTRQRRTLTVLALSLTLLGSALPAFAGSGITDNRGTVGNGNGTGNEGKVANAQNGCDSQNRRTDHGVPFTRQHWPKCDSPTTWNWTQKFKLCPTGVLAYRFYGRKDGSIQATTVTRLHTVTNDCGMGVPNAAFPGGGLRLFSPNPADAGVDSPGKPYVDHTAPNLYGETVVYAEPKPDPNGGAKLTTAPTLLAHSGSCMREEADLLSTVINDDRPGYEKDIYAKSYLPNKNLGEQSAIQVASGSHGVDNTAKRVAYGPTQPCSTPWQYASWKNDVDAHNYAAQRVVGTCYSYLQQQGTEFKGMVSGSETYRYGYELKYQEAIDRTEVDKYSQQPPRGPGEEKMPNYYQKWRDYMQAHIASDLGAGQPHQQYTFVGEGQPGIDRNLSATQFARKSFCDSSPQKVVVRKCDPKTNPKCQEPCPPPPPGSLCPPPCPGQQAPSCPLVNKKQKQADPPGMLNIDLNVPDVFQVGGFERPGVALATSGGFHNCNLPECALSGLVYHVKLTGIGGYIDCRGQASSSCDFTVRDPNNTKVGSGEDAPIVSSDELTAAFYTAGTPAKKVKVELDVTTSVYAWTHCHPTPAGCDYHRHHFNDFTPTFTFSQHDGTSSGKHAEVIVDVIGANNQSGPTS